jgi:hypothetical protein
MALPIGPLNRLIMRLAVLLKPFRRLMHNCIKKYGFYRLPLRKDLLKIDCFSERLGHYDFLKDSGLLRLPRYLNCLNLPANDSIYVLLAFHFNYVQESMGPGNFNSNFNTQICMVQNGQPVYFRRVQSKTLGSYRDKQDYPARQMQTALDMLMRDFPNLP